MRLSRDERTVFRTIEDYELASKLPPIVIEALEAKNLDPAAPKNAGIVDKLAQMPEPSTRNKAEARVLAENTTRKKMTRAAKKRGRESLTSAARNQVPIAGELSSIKMDPAG